MNLNWFLIATIFKYRNHLRWGFEKTSNKYEYNGLLKWTKLFWKKYWKYLNIVNRCP